MLYIFLKRTFDLAVSFLGLIFFCPLMLYIGYKIKKEDRGSIFYRGVRIGMSGKPFRIFKFRTMVENAERIGSLSTSEDDARITKVGRFLRKYKLDEIPQFINVLKGEMSFVGPRPEVPAEVDTYSEQEKKILSVRPGITDWASLHFHDEGEILKGSMDPHKTYQEKIKPKKLQLAIQYVEDRSFLTDIKIILDTMLTLFRTRR